MKANYINEDRIYSLRKIKLIWCYGFTAPTQFHMVCLVTTLFVVVKHPSKQFFSHVGTEQPLFGLFYGSFYKFS